MHMAAPSSQRLWKAVNLWPHPLESPSWSVGGTKCTIIINYVQLYYQGYGEKRACKSNVHESKNCIRSIYSIPVLRKTRNQILQHFSSNIPPPTKFLLVDCCVPSSLNSYALVITNDSYSIKYITSKASSTVTEIINLIFRAEVVDTMNILCLEILD